MSQKLLRGFTAIELIAGVCVLLILAGIVIAESRSWRAAAPT